MNPRHRLPRRLVLLSALVLTLSCAKRERSEVWNGEGVDESAEKGLLPGHVHLFELVQWGSPSGGIVAGKRAERDALRLALAKLQVELLEARIGRGILEERPVKVIRVQYTLENWEKQKNKVKRPPDGKIEETTLTTPKQPNRPSRPVPGVIVEQLQEQLPREVVRSPEEARAFWAEKLAEAEHALAAQQEAAERAAAASASGDRSAAPPVEKTRVSFAVLSPRDRHSPFEPPQEPRGWPHCEACQASAKRRGAFVLHGLGGLSPEPPAFADRAGLERGVELTAPTRVSGLDAAGAHAFDPKDGRLVLRLAGHCPARVFQVAEELRATGSYVIGISTRVGDARWFELIAPGCGGEPALRTRVTDLVAGAAPGEEQALEAELRRLGGEYGAADARLKRIQAMGR